MKSHAYLPIAGLAAFSLFAMPLAASEHNRPGDRDHSSQYRQNQSSDRMGARTPSTVEWKDLKSASDIIGKEIKNREGEKVGEIDNLFISTGESSVVAVVASTGSFLDLGGHRSLLIADNLKYNSDEEHFVAEMSANQLRSAPRYLQGDSRGLDRIQRETHETRAGHTGRYERDQRALYQARAGQTGIQSQRGQTDTRMGQTSRFDDESRFDRAGRADHTIAVTDMKGMKIHNRQGDSIGAIDAVYVDWENQRVPGVVVSTGDFLRMDGHQTLLSLNELRYDREEGVFQVNLSQNELRDAPAYDDGNESIWDDLRARWESARQSGSAALTDMRDTASREFGRAQDRVQQPRAAASATSTAIIQGTSREDREMTASIRRALRDDDDISMRAQNITIITRDGKVVLRGEVESNQQKSAIEKIAKEKAGSEKVESELRVNR